MTRVSKRIRMGLSASVVAQAFPFDHHFGGNREIGFGKQYLIFSSAALCLIAAAILTVHLLLFIKERREKG
jgi:hypothetical protein